MTAQLPQGLSPLDLLEQRSRRLATRLQDPQSSGSSHQSNLQQAKKSVYNPLRSSYEDENEDQDTDEDQDKEDTDGSSTFRSKHNSTASIGSILGNFRLSTLSIMENSNNNTDLLTPTSVFPDATPRYPSTNKINTLNRTSAHSNYPGITPRSSSYSGYPSRVKDPETQHSKLPARPSLADSRSGVRSFTEGSTSERSSIHIINRFSSYSNSTEGPISSTRHAPTGSQKLSNSLSSSHQPINDTIEPGFFERRPVYQTLSDQTRSPLVRTGSQISSRSRNSIDSRNQQQPQLSVDNESYKVLRGKSLNNSLTLEEHVSLGIMYHEKGNLRGSSYHWQFAAFKNEPTAMLLYGLALRHGWGIKQNPGEAAKWLRRVIGPTIDGYSLDDVLKPETTKNLQVALFNTSAPTKVKKAQIALALYELGMCYLKSWGVEKDEEMALRCFELAGSMGDVDGLSEAAGLWMHSGPKGRKKNLLRAAKLYRTAGEKGANMVSNSWIYKDKYMGEDKNLKK